MKSSNENIIILLDCFSGADGGISFIKLRQFLESIEQPPVSEEAYQMLLALERLAKLITILENN